MTPDFVRRTDLEASILELMVRYRHPLKLFGLSSSTEYAKQVADHLGVELIPHTETTFEDGECYIKSCDGSVGNVRGHNVFVISSLYTDAVESVNDKFMKLAIFCGSLRQASAHSITAVIPHFAYARQDQKDKSRAPVTTKICAKMLESVGVERFLFMDVHNLAAAQNAFAMTTNMDNLECKNLHAAWCAKELQGMHRKLAVLSPDSGGLKRANKFRSTLAHLIGVSEYEIELAVLDKIRDPHTGRIDGGRIIGDVKGRLVIALDDMISTGGTIVRGCEAVERHGGEVFAICATHGLFAGEANENLSKIDARIVVADTVSPFRLNEQNRMKLHIVNTSKIMADAIRRIHSGTGSISALLENLDSVYEQL
jgi:ribose-phosphate pyrophosphokinase